LAESRVAKWLFYFQTKFSNQKSNPNLSKFWKILQCKMLIYFTAIRSILLPFGIHSLWPFGVVSGHLVYFMVIWYVGMFSRFGMLHQEKSGDPGGKVAFHALPPFLTFFLLLPKMN
jgi:hypothetical protein